jgi:hypothetical protein
MRGKSKPGILREKWLGEIRVVRGVTLTKQSNPRSAKNDQTIHGKIETSVKKGPVVTPHALGSDRTPTSVLIPGLGGKLSQSVGVRGKVFRVWGVRYKCSFRHPRYPRQPVVSIVDTGRWSFDRWSATGCYGMVNTWKCRKDHLTVTNTSIFKLQVGDNSHRTRALRYHQHG